MNKKINVAILFGGRSAEHEVSLESAKNVIDAIDKKKYNLTLIRIDKNGKWFLGDKANFLSGNCVALVPQSNGEIVNFSHQGTKPIPNIDVVFPVLHGPFGEDGTVQGLLKLANVPFVGAGVLGSAIGMDKDVMKRLLRDAGIPIAKFFVFIEGDNADFKKISRAVGLPFFVKPANLGSSVGVSKVKSKKDFSKALSEAFQYDRKILVEEHIDGREVECSVLGNDEPIASLPGEVIVKSEFYSYEAKYLDENGALLEIPAKIPKKTAEDIQKLAIKTFKILSREGMARVDFFLKKNKKIFVNEINTIPGFTSISMYPKLWEASGVGLSELIDRLIGLAVERFQKEQKLETTIDSHR